MGHTDIMYSNDYAKLSRHPGDENLEISLFFQFEGKEKPLLFV